MIPSGELRLGMTTDQVIHLLRREAKASWDTEGFPHANMVDLKIGDRAISAILTAKGIVYSIHSQDTFPGDPVGKQAAEAAFQNYLKTYSAPSAPPIFRTPEVTGQAWTSKEGHLTKVVLMCDETVLIVEIDDYQRQLADDGESDEKRQYFRESGPYSPSRCF